MGHLPCYWCKRIILSGNRTGVPRVEEADAPADCATSSPSHVKSQWYKSDYVMTTFSSKHYMVLNYTAVAAYFRQGKHLTSITIDNCLIDYLSKQLTNWIQNQTCLTASYTCLLRWPWWIKKFCLLYIHHNYNRYTWIQWSLTLISM